MPTQSFIRLLVVAIIATLVPAFAQLSPASTAPYRCVAFGPYVGNDPATGQLLNPNTGPHPGPPLIDSLLDVVVAQGFSCIQTYGFLNGLDYIIPAAKNRNLKVVAIAWLDWSQQTPTASFANALNGPSIAKAIQMAKTYPETIVRLSCGSEYVSRNAAANRALVPELENAIRFCLTELRAQGVTQPLTSIDTWWEWCNASYPCRARALAANIDWIGINVFPWWENRFSGLPGFTCTTAANAGAFTLARANDVLAVYDPLGFGKDKIAVTEFGWPRQPEGFRETNLHTGQPCVGGEAGNLNHDFVIGDTLRLLDQAGFSAHMFALAIERWKPEPNVGGSWGDCDDAPPYPGRFPGYLKLSADLLRPVPGSNLEGTSPTFLTSKGAGNGLAIWLDVGTSFGNGDLFAGIVQNQSQVVTNLPCDGRTLFVRLWTRIDGSWRSPFDYRLKACTDNRARLQIPAAASTLPGDSQLFSWFAAVGATKYWLDVGTVARQGNIVGGETTATQVTVTNLPCDGRTLYASLWTFRNGAWDLPVDYVFTACNDGRARIWLPVRGSTFPQGPVQIQWFGLAGAQAYWLDVGNSLGSGDLFGSQVSGTQAAINNLPCDGRNLYVRLWTRAGGAWRTPVDYQYKACSGGGSGPVRAVINSPSPGSALTGTVTFTWTAPQGAAKYWLDVGCALGQGTIFARELTGVSQSVPGVSCGQGQPIYVRLWTYSGSVWLSPVDFTYQSL